MFRSLISGAISVTLLLILNSIFGEVVAIIVTLVVALAMCIFVMGIIASGVNND